MCCNIEGVILTRLDYIFNTMYSSHCNMINYPSPSYTILAHLNRMTTVSLEMKRLMCDNIMQVLEACDHLTACNKNANHYKKDHANLFRGNTRRWPPWAHDKIFYFNILYCWCVLVIFAYLFVLKLQWWFNVYLGDLHSCKLILKWIIVI